MSEKSKGNYFVRVLVTSGTRFNPLGDEELAVYCQFAEKEPSVDEVDREDLLRWVNSNPSFKRNQSNEQFRISKSIDAMLKIFLSDREIQACRAVNRIFQS